MAAALSHSPITFTTPSSASDLLRSWSSGFNGVPLKVLGKGRLRASPPPACNKTPPPLAIISKMRKVKKIDRPWPADPDPNVKGGVLTHLSVFKPLPEKEKPKPVTLDFEKPLMSLEKKINDVRKMAAETGLDFTDQITSLENKYHQALKDLYTHLVPIQRVQIARHPNRPTFLDHIFNITDKFVELHGDRGGYDDPAIVCGIGSIDGQRYMFMGHQKGRNTKENIKRNFGMPTPHGYRKALRFMYYADHHGFPIVTFIDTPGAFADLKSEELGQGEAIAHNLRSMFGLKVPVISIVIGEGGSGGALAIGCANKLLMLENAVFYVASPEACAAILWKSAKASPKAAEKLKITASELCKLKIADGIIPEPLGGAHADPTWTSQQIKKAITEAMDELKKMDTETLLHDRWLKFRHLGGFQVVTQMDPAKKLNMKKRDIPVKVKRSKPILLKQRSLKQRSIKARPRLVDEIKRLKKAIQKSIKTSSKIPKLDVVIAKLKKEVNQEFSKAVQTLGLKEKFQMLREEIANARSTPDQLIASGVKDKIDELTQEFNQGLTQAPNYKILKYKLDTLEELSQAKKLTVEKAKVNTLKTELNMRIKKVMDRPDVKEKIDALKAESAKAGVSLDGDTDHPQKEKYLRLKKEIEMELANVFNSINSDVDLVESKAKEFSEQTIAPALKSKIEELNQKIQKEIEDAINSKDVQNMIELLKLEITKVGNSPDPESKKLVEALKQQIKQTLEEAVSSPALIEKHEKLKEEIAKAMRSSRGSDGNLKQDEPVEVNIGGGYN